jgi:cation:H+ antiporter
LSRIDGVVLLIFFVSFLYYVYTQLAIDQSANEKHETDLSFIRILLYITLGLAGLVIGGRMIVNSSVEIARILAVSEKIIGLTIVAAGTSLPELATSVVAAIKKNNDIAVGNIIGSNIFNIFFILGVSSLIKPVKFNNAFNTDIYLLAAGTVILFIAMFTGKKKRLDRWEAAILMLIYTLYTYYLIHLEI